MKGDVISARTARSSQERAKLGALRSGAYNAGISVQQLDIHAFVFTTDKILGDFSTIQIICFEMIRSK